MAEGELFEEEGEEEKKENMSKGEERTQFKPETKRNLHRKRGSERTNQMITFLQALGALGL